MVLQHGYNAVAAKPMPCICAGMGVCFPAGAEVQLHVPACMLIWANACYLLLQELSYQYQHTC